MTNGTVLKTTQSRRHLDVQVAKEVFRFTVSKGRIVGGSVVGHRNLAIPFYTQDAGSDLLTLRYVYEFWDRMGRGQFIAILKPLGLTRIVSYELQKRGKR